MREFNIGDVFYLPANSAHFIILEKAEKSELSRKSLYNFWWFEGKCKGAAFYSDFTEANGKMFLFEEYECIQLSEKDALFYKLKYA